MADGVKYFWDRDAGGLLEDISGRLMGEPAVAFQEMRVADVVKEICREHGMKYQEDTFGNIHINAARGKSGAPLYYVAHMDHPGFEVVHGSRNRLSLKVQFHGGVPDRYFKDGTRVIAYPGGLRGKIRERVGKGKKFVIELDRPYGERPTMVVWDLKNFQRSGDRIRGRACDDLMGLASLLVGLITFKRSGCEGRIFGLVTRAEEVGFYGALAAASGGLLPANGLYISLENSKELPPVKMGCGVIVRSGDRLSQFDSAGVYFLTRVAEDIRAGDPSFSFQKALMPGGACEATAFAHFGLRAAAMCIPLGNYHNCGRSDTISTEYVSFSDALSMARLVAISAQRASDFKVLEKEAKERISKLAREAVRKLKGSS